MMRFLARRSLLGIADYAVTMPAIRWTWTGPSDDEMIAALDEFRPTDRETVIEMMAGRYLLASKLIDTHGVSPFTMNADHADWLDELHAFAWLRHFRDARTDDERRFARALTLDWIGRYGLYNRKHWSLSLCARRVLNWLRHFSILVEGASMEQTGIIARSLSTQVQSLKLRARLARDPVDALLAAIALMGVALCDEKRAREIPKRLQQVNRLLALQLDQDGLHLTRSAKVQVMLLVELVTIKHALRRYHEQYAAAFTQSLEAMHEALDAITLGTGEPGFFNGTGQMPHDLVVALQAQSPARARATAITGGYGRLVAGRSIVVCDSGLVPPPEFARQAHASALAFEFSHGRELIVCNCGPAPAELPGSTLLFREGIAHSAPTINALSAATIHTKGALAGRLEELGEPPRLTTDAADHSLAATTYGYVERFGVVLERRLTLLAEGKTLVGQDRITPETPTSRVSGACAIRFHLAPGTEVQAADDLLRLRLAPGAVWTFLWEGAAMRVEDSVRQSAYFGFHKTRQIVLDAHVGDASEVSWIFTREDA